LRQILVLSSHLYINATPEKMMVIKDKYYHPNNSILVITGDVKHDKAFELAKSIFGDWSNSGFDPHEKYPIPEFKPLAKTDYFIKELSIAQTPFIMLSWHGPEYRNDSAATLAADLFTTALSLNSSKWHQALIDKGLANYAGVSYTTNRFVGPIQLFVVPNPDKLKECYNEVLNQINQFADPEYLTEEQLQTAKDVFRRNEIRSNEKPSSLSMQLTYWWASTSLDYFTNYVDNVMKVTRQDIANYAAKYIKNKPYVAGMVISPDMNKKYNPGDFFKLKDL